MAYHKMLEQRFYSMKDPRERLEFLCEIRARMKAMDSFLKESYDWVLEQTDADLKACGVSYKMMPAVRRLSGPAIRKADPELYAELMELYSSESKEYIQICYRGAKK